MNIIFYYDQLANGGAERQMMLMCASMIARGHDAWLLTLFGGGQVWNEAIAAGLPVQSLVVKRPKNPIIRIIHHILAPYRLGKKIPKNLGAVVLTAGGTPNLVGGLLKLIRHDFRHIASIRNTFTKWGWKTDLTVAAYRRLCFASDGVIANSRSGLTSYIKAGFKFNNGVIIPNGIDVSKYRSDKEERAAVRKELGIRDDQIVVMHIGRFHPMKNHVGFVELAKLFAEDDKLVFCMIGKQINYDNKSLLPDAAQDAPANLKLLGQRSDVHRLLNAADLFCMNSFGEGFPNVVGEAMATYVPCVVSDCGDAIEVVGDTGWACHRNTIEEFRDVIVQYQNLDKEQINDFKRKARERIVSNFSLGNLSYNIEKYMRDLDLAPSNSNTKQ